jgi:uncharacterized membrane protein YqiK
LSATAANTLHADSWDEEGNKKSNQSSILGTVLLSASAIAVFGLFYVVSRYKRCPANQILVIQGAFTKGAKWLINNIHTFLY